MWVIAAGARVGQMWGKYVAEFRAAPIPKEWKQPGNSPFGDPNDPTAPPLSWAEIRGAYYASLDNASEGDKQRAKGAYKKCLDYSVKYQFFDEYSRTCEVWLSKFYGAEYHLIDEFRGTPNRVNSGASERGQPLNLDGSPFSVELPPVPEKEPAKAEADEQPQAPAKANQSKEQSAIDKAVGAGGKK
jgi:hypothetical protein